jgi:hypothetical protein
VSQQNNQSDRREFIKLAGAVGAVSAFSSLKAPRVFGQAGANHSLQLALIGAGGRGTGAVVDAIGPTT